MKKTRITSVPETGKRKSSVYLKSLVWDKKPRLNQWLFKYLGVESSWSAADYGRKFLTQCVARVFDENVSDGLHLVIIGCDPRKALGDRLVTWPESKGPLTWCSVVSAKADLKALRRDADQIWAETVFRYNEPARYSNSK